MKTSDLIGPALDWAVAKCEGLNVFTQPIANNQTKYCVFTTRTNYKGEEEYGPSSFSVNWAQGGPIIEREGLGVSQYNNIPDRPENRWQCVKYAGGMLLGNHRPICAYGPTPLIAAMRCYVASKLGDEVEIPEELKCNSSTHQP